MKRFTVATVSVAAISAAYYQHPAPDRGTDIEFIDHAITNGMPVVLGLAALVILISRSHWTLRGIGVFYITLASAFLLLALGHGRRMGPGTTEFVADLSRACFIVGGPALLFGVLVWLWFWFRHRGERGDDEDINGTPYTGPERRKEDRREETRLMKMRLAELEGRR